MFGSDGGEGQVNLGRRLFLSGVGAALGGAALFSLRRPRVIAEAAKTEPAEVTIVQFSDAGQRLAKVKVARVVKSDEEWRKQLPSGVYEITRHADTELAYSGKYWNLHDKGIFRCICCDNALFSSATKFDSGTGWPSFWEPIAKGMFREISDSSIGHGANSGRVQGVRCASGTCVRRRSEADGAAVLHELGIAAVCEGSVEAARLETSLSG